ncbi:hypothetical protein TanjilG_12623 [Lupinus angustifolius]|uniref:ZF-HD dimerization-type domain-containing protein n=1 Tax=Lupinus angustifolius TaxID=3871 RepID=A0A4P1QYZ8_LUPAN|nr:PREDICTED: zinc-finger homeodomain protein 2-like [Lupinus angustifolius]OIV97866.1 hypothetical protein TanjilG_12623 [Lupinus angustifolius]
MEKVMEFAEQGNQVQEQMGVQVPPPEQASLENSTPVTNTRAAAENGAASATPGQMERPIVGTIRYKECQRNHASAIGGYAVDGCGEFLAAGGEGTLAVTCAACNCHRNFHRKEVVGAILPQPPVQHHHNQFTPHYHHVPPPPPGAGYQLVAVPPLRQHHPLALPAPSDGGYNHEEVDMSNPNNGGKPKKRFRTKFTQEQKDKMAAFAEKLGWKIQKHDAATVEQFCAEIGVKTQVLKVWMHNNKHTHCKKT